MTDISINPNIQIPQTECPIIRPIFNYSINFAFCLAQKLDKMAKMHYIKPVIHYTRTIKQTHHKLRCSRFYA